MDPGSANCFRAELAREYAGLKQYHGSLALAGHTSPERSRRNPPGRQRLVKLRSTREKTRPTLHNGETVVIPSRRIRQLKELIESNAIQVLNVAGPRESNESGVYRFALEILRTYWENQEE